MDHIRLAFDGPVARLTLARPERRNALSLALMSEVMTALRGLPAETRVVVIAGDGPVFSAGHDISEMVGREAGFYDELFETCIDMMETIHRIPQPVIARVHGVATAAGCQLVASCDLVVAAGAARFATPGVKIGLFCSTPMVPISRAVGQKRAMEMLLTGDLIDAPTALQWGLVNRVVDASELDAEVDRLVDRIVGYSPRVIAIGKDAFYRQTGLHEHEAYATTKPVMAANAAGAAAQEGMSAFLEKRTPDWPE